MSFSWWTFRKFFISVCSGDGKGESEAPGRGGGETFLLKIPGGGGGLPGGWGAGGARSRRVFAGFWGGGAAIFFFSGPKFPPSFRASRCFDLLFGIKIFLTSNLQDIEAPKSTHGLIQGKR